MQYKEQRRCELIGPSTKIAAEITTVDLAGYIPGHCGSVIRSGNETLLHGADLLAHYILALARPDWSFYATHDKPTEIAAKKAWFAQAADERMLVFFCQMPIPNVGHVSGQNDVFGWQPEQYTWT